MLKLHTELVKNGLKEWSTCPGQYGISIIAEFNTFQQAFRVLNKYSTINCVHFQHRWYSNWSWIEREHQDGAFFEDIHEELNVDCIREIIDKLDLLHIFYFAHINERCEFIAKKNLSRLHIFPSTVGSIGLMNFRYMLEMIGSSLKEISLSLKAFATLFGFYFDHFKKYILILIYMCAGKELKKISLFDFDLSKTQKLDYVQLFSERGIQIKFNNS